MHIRYKRLHPNAKKPRRAYKSVGYDVFPVDSGIIPAGGYGPIRLGFAAEFADDHVAQVADRGSTGTKGLKYLAGVIDPDYRGEWVIWLLNAGLQDYHYTPDKACAQILFVKTEEAVDYDGPDGWAEQLTGTEREAACLGSSDKQNVQTFEQAPKVHRLGAHSSFNARVQALAEQAKAEGIIEIYPEEGVVVDT